MTASNAVRTQLHAEGVTVIGEAVRRATPESGEFLIEVTTSAPTAAQALRDNQMKTAQITQAISSLGVQPADLQTISLKIQNVYSSLLPASLGYGGMPQVGPAVFAAYSGAAPGPQPEIQLGTYYARSIVRVSVREPGRAGEIADAAARAGAILVGPFSFHAADEASARRAALEAAGRDARLKAEALATATGRQLGDAMAVTEDILASNGTYSALRTTMPFAFGAGAPELVGEFEYYARVSASFRFQ